MCWLFACPDEVAPRKCDSASLALFRACRIGAHHKNKSASNELRGISIGLVGRSLTLAAVLGRDVLALWEHAAGNYCDGARVLN